MNESKFVLLPWILLVLALIVVAGGLGYYVATQKTTGEKASTATTSSPTALPSTTPAPSTNSGATDTTSSKKETYTNATYNFSLKYPNTYSATKDKSPVDAWGGDNWWALALSGNMDKKVTRITNNVLATAAFQAYDSNLKKNITVKRSVTIATFDFVAVAGQLVPSGQDREPLPAAKTLANLPNGYFEAGLPDLGVGNQCEGVNTYIPDKTVTIMLTVYECSLETPVSLEEGMPRAGAQADVLSVRDMLLGTMQL